MKIRVGRCTKRRFYVGTEPVIVGYWTDALTGITTDPMILGTQAPRFQVLGSRVRALGTSSFPRALRALVCQGLRPASKARGTRYWVLGSGN